MHGISWDCLLYLNRYIVYNIFTCMNKAHLSQEYRMFIKLYMNIRIRFHTYILNIYLYYNIAIQVYPPVQPFLSRIYLRSTEPTSNDFPYAYACSEKSTQSCRTHNLFVYDVGKSVEERVCIGFRYQYTHPIKRENVPYLGFFHDNEL